MCVCSFSLHSCAEIGTVIITVSQARELRPGQGRRFGHAGTAGPANLSSLSPEPVLVTTAPHALSTWTDALNTRCGQWWLNGDGKWSEADSHFGILERVYRPDAPTCRLHFCAGRCRTHLWLTIWLWVSHFFYPGSQFSYFKKNERFG